MFGTGGEFVGGSSAPASASPNLPGNGITSGSLSTLTALQLNAGHQVDATSARYVVLSGIQTGGGAGVVSISPDNVTYSILGDVLFSATVPACVGIYVPEGWYLKVTDTNITGTYY